MSTLLLRLAGPLQSWGTQSRFSERDTGYEPSKSGVIGLLCAALGLERHKPVDRRLVALSMGVRVDREGALLKDFHTAGGTHRRGDAYNVVRADGKPGGTVPSNRYYLADASFLVGLESDDEALLRCLEEALLRPHWQLFLGRKSCVPGEPVTLSYLPNRPRGLQDTPLEEALRRYPWFRGAYAPWANHPSQLRLVLDTDSSDPRASDIRRDVPISFAERTFANRHVRTDWVDEFQIGED